MILANVIIVGMIALLALWLIHDKARENYEKGRAHAYIEVAEALRALESGVSLDELASQLVDEAFHISEAYQ